MNILVTVAVTMLCIVGDGAKQIARTGFDLDLDEDNASLEDLSNEDGNTRPLAIIIVNKNEDEEDSSSSEESLSDDSEDVSFPFGEIDDTVNPNVMLRKLWKGCNKKASKVCRKACIRAYKDACASYKCKSKLKKALKKDCKRNCKDLFVRAQD